jgi:PleD family two-component response regulator
MGDKRVILAIDDLPMELAVFENILGQTYDLKICSSAPEALTALENVKSDLILLDIEMPGMSGFEFLHQIRKIPKLMNTPVIIVSSHSGEEFTTHATQQGANDLLSKPVNPNELRNRVSYYLEHAPPKNKLEEMLQRKLTINRD